MPNLPSRRGGYLTVVAYWSEQDDTDTPADAVKPLKVDGTIACAVNFGPGFAEMPRLLHTLRMMDLAEVADSRHAIPDKEGEPSDVSDKHEAWDVEKVVAAALDPDLTPPYGFKLPAFPRQLRSSRDFERLADALKNRMRQVLVDSGALKLWLMGRDRLLADDVVESVRAALADYEPGAGGPTSRGGSFDIEVPDGAAVRVYRIDVTLRHVVEESPTMKGKK